MNLPPKALSALVNIRKELLSKSVMITSTPVRIPMVVVPSGPIVPGTEANVMITRGHSHVMRHARSRGMVIQHMYQRGQM